MMAKLDIDGTDEIFNVLSEIETCVGDISKVALYDGAKVLADEIKSNLKALPTDDPDRKLRNEERYAPLTTHEKEHLLKGFGISKIRGNSVEGHNVAVGFGGYGNFKTKKYPKGVPNQLLARSVESGSSVRQKHPFVRPAINKVRRRVVETMGKTIELEIKKITK